MTSAIGMPNSKSVVKALPSQMTVLPNGNVGVGTTNPTTKLQVYGTLQINDFSSIIQAFPSGPMTSYTTNISASYGSGIYVASASSEYQTSYVWLCFNKTYAPSESLWQTGAWSTTSPYGPTTATVTLDINNAQYAGEWIQIQMPCSIILSSYNVVSSTYAAPTQSPATFWILGSVNGTQWVLLDSRAGVTDWVNSTIKSFSVTNTQAYSYYRFVINKLNGNTGYGQLAEWILNGKQEIINTFSGGNAIINGSFYSPGSVVQCITTLYTAMTTYSAPNTITPTEITVLNVTITPKRANSKVVLQWMINGDINHETIFLVYRDSTAIGFNTTSGSNAQWSGVTASPSDNDVNSTPQNIIVNWVDLPNTTNAVTYSVRVRASGGVAYTLYLGRSAGTTGSQAYETPCSTGVAWEICV
jgi:hypothetical protein